jgi:hypothetical protein
VKSAIRHKKSTAANRKIALNQVRSVRRREQYALKLIRRAYPDGSHVRWWWEEHRRPYTGIVVGFLAREMLDSSLFRVRFDGDGKVACVAAPIIAACNAPPAPGVVARRRKRT